MKKFKSCQAFKITKDLIVNYEIFTNIKFKDFSGNESIVCKWCKKTVNDPMPFREKLFNNQRKSDEEASNIPEIDNSSQLSAID